MTTYYDSAENIMITKDRMIKELNDHCCGDDISDFIKEYGDHNEYNAQDVLTFLGY